MKQDKYLLHINPFTIILQFEIPHDCSTTCKECILYNPDPHFTMVGSHHCMPCRRARARVCLIDLRICVFHQSWTTRVLESQAYTFIYIILYTYIMFVCIYIKSLVYPECLL